MSSWRTMKFHKLEVSLRNHDLSGTSQVVTCEHLNRKFGGNSIIFWYGFKSASTTKFATHNEFATIHIAIYFTITILAFSVLQVICFLSPLSCRFECSILLRWGDILLFCRTHPQGLPVHFLRRVWVRHLCLPLYDSVDYPPLVSISNP